MLFVVASTAGSQCHLRGYLAIVVETKLIQKDI